MKNLLFKLNYLFSQELLYEGLWPTNHETFICDISKKITMHESNQVYGVRWFENLHKEL